MWAKDYKIQVNDAVNRVITELGKKRETAARWLVYDKVSGLFPKYSTHSDFLLSLQTAKAVCTGIGTEFVGWIVPWKLWRVLSGYDECFSGGVFLFSFKIGLGLFSVLLSLIRLKNRNSSYEWGPDGFNA